MALVLNGSGSITGLSAGGLPDGSVTADDIASLPAGSVIQVVSTVKTDTYSAAIASSDALATPTGFSVSITPSSASNKILVLASFNMAASVSVYITNAVLLRNGSSISIADAAGSRRRRTIGRADPGGVDNMRYSTISFLDSPNTTSSTTYSIGIGSDQALTVYLNRSHSDDDAGYMSRGASSIIAMEIAA